MTRFIHQMQPLIGKEEKEAVMEYMSSGGWLTEFKETEKFEQMIAKYVGAKHCCVVNNGTVSLFVALRALGIGPGDDVLVPNFTMIATANAVLLAGAKPVLVDIDPATLCMDLSLGAKALSKRTKAVIYVSLNGRSGNLEEVKDFCKKHELFLIEDAAQSLGSTWKGKHLGTFGEIGTFSFSQHKIITTGQGGALVTNDDTLITKVRKLKDFGRVKPGVDQHDMLGFNFKFTDLQASIGVTQMKKLKKRIIRKKAMYRLYKKELSYAPIQFIETDLSQTAPWFIDVLVKGRDKLIEHLKRNGIGARQFYPPIHTQAPYNAWKRYLKKLFPVSEEISHKGLWLPSSLLLTDRDIKTICAAIRSFYQ